MTTNTLPPEGVIDVSIKVTLQDHLKRLEVAELSKLPNNRKKIPSLPDLAEAVGVTRQAMHNLATNRVTLVNLTILSAVLSELRRQGFPTDVSDVLVAYPADAVEVDR